MSDFETQAWEEAFAAEVVTEEAAAEEVAAESDESAAHTADEVGETVEVAEEQHSEEVATEEESAEELEEESADNFQDLLDPIPTPESLLAKHKRIPQETKDELVNLVTNWRQTHEQLQKFGGEEGVKVFEPVINLIRDPSPSQEAVQDAYAALFGANQQATLQMTFETARFFLSDEAKQMGHGAIGDRILESVFGVDGQTIRDYIQLEKAGYIDRENDLKLLDSEGVGSSLFEKQQSEIDQLRAELREANERIANPEKLLKKEQVEATTSFEEKVVNRITEATDPFVERGRWGKDSPLTKVVRNALVAELKNEPEFKSAIKAVQQNGENYAIQQAVNTLVNKAKARMDNYNREINGQFKQRTETSRNAVVKEKVEQTRPKSESLKSRPSTFDQLGTPDWEEQAWKEYGAFV